MLRVSLLKHRETTYITGDAQSMWILQTVETHGNENGKDLDVSALKIQRSSWKRNLHNRTRVILHQIAIQFLLLPLQYQLQRQRVGKLWLELACARTSHSQENSIRKLVLVLNHNKAVFLSEFSRNWNEIMRKDADQSKHLISVLDFFFLQTKYSVN